MSSILQSDYFWGTIVGLILSFVGGWVLAKFTVSLTNKNAKRTVINFCIDTVKNLRAIVEDMDQARDRSKVIYPDFLALIDVEMTVYGRNREHLIRLPDQERNLVRKFMNDVAIRKATIAGKLDSFQKVNGLADQILAEGRAPEATRLRASAEGFLREAHEATDKLVKIAESAAGILDKLAEI